MENLPDTNKGVTGTPNLDGESGGPGKLSRRRFVIGLGAFGLASGLLAACGDIPAASGDKAAITSSAGIVTAPSTGTSGPTIGLVMKSLANDYFKDMQNGAISYQQQKSNFKLVALGIQNETDIDEQANLVDRLIQQKVDAIVIAPADSFGLVPVLAKAVNAGIKVINIDVKLDDNAMKKANIDLAFVGPDNASAAKLPGDILAKRLGNGGKVVILEGNPGADNATQRKNGFLASIKEGNLSLLDSKSAHWETEEARVVFKNMLKAYPGLQGVMCSNDSMALGVLKALNEVRAESIGTSIHIVSFDNTAAIQPFIKQDKVLATLDQFGSQQAIFGIDNALKLIAGNEVRGWIKTPVRVITKSELVI